MNQTQRWLAMVRPRHNPAENALIANMRDDPNIPWLNSLAAMRHYCLLRPLLIRGMRSKNEILVAETRGNTISPIHFSSLHHPRFTQPQSSSFRASPPEQLGS